MYAVPSRKESRKVHAVQKLRARIRRQEHGSKRYLSQAASLIETPFARTF